MEHPNHDRNRRGRRWAPGGAVRLDLDSRPLAKDDPRGHIEAVGAREILDSPRQPTVEVEVALDDGTLNRAAVRSGASTGAFEAVELRDATAATAARRRKAVSARSGDDRTRIVGFEASEQRLVDAAMIALDRPRTKSKLGANAILGVSLPWPRRQPSRPTAAVPVPGRPERLPAAVPMMNIVNGGAHAIPTSTSRNS